MPLADHSGLSANSAGVLNAQSWRLIIVWLEVRVLPTPPRSLMQKEICRFLASRPDFAGVRATSKPKKSNRGGPKHANEHTFRKGTTVHRPSGAENRLNKQCKEMLATCFESVGGLAAPTSGYRTRRDSAGFPSPI